MTEPALEGDFVFECPNCKEAGNITALSTTAAISRTPIDGGLRFTGIICLECHKSYTVEATDAGAGVSEP